MIDALGKAKSASATIAPIGGQPIKLALSVTGLSDALAALQATPQPLAPPAGRGASRTGRAEIDKIAAPAPASARLFGLGVRLVDENASGGPHRVELLSPLQLELLAVSPAERQ